MPEHAEAVIAVGNLANSAARATVKFSNGDSEDVEVPAFGTRLIRKRSEQLHSPSNGDGEAVSVSAPGSNGSIIVAGAVTAIDGSFTSSIRFYDTQNVAQPNLYATNFRLKNVKPRLLLRNTGTETISAIPRFIPVFGDPNGFMDLPSVTLRPNEIADIDIEPLKGAVYGRADFDDVSIQVLNTGGPGSLIGALNGKDSSTGMTYDVPLRDIGGLRNSTGAYPWRLDHDLSTNVSITNIAPMRSEIVVQINYPGGPYLLNPRRLAAGETVIYDLRKIRDEQIPDSSGHTIPLSVTGGQFKWFIHGAGSGRLIGRAEMLSLSEGVSSSYSCPGSSCPAQFSYATLVPGNVDLAPGDTVTERPQEVDCDSYFNCTPPFTPLVTGWDVTNLEGAVVVYDNGDTLDLVGYQGGTAYIKANIGYEQYYWDEFTSSCTDEGMDSGYVEGQATVPKVDIALNGNTVTGQTVNVIVGQKMNLTTSVNPSNGSVTNSQWTVPGGDSDRIANWVVVPPPQNGYTPTSATVTNLATLTNSSVDFYWITAGSRTVQYTAKVNQKSVQAQVTFNVQKPTAQISIATSSTNIGVDSQSGLTELRFGNPDTTPGLTFTQTVSIPSGFNGSTEWVQVFTKKSVSVTDPDAHVSGFNYSGLDDKYPYPLDARATSANHKASDAPGGPIDGYVAASVDFEATMWLMFRPTAGTNPIWVPLRQVSWVWTANATYDGATWTINSHSDPTNLSDSDSTNHPTWTKNATTGN